MNLGKSYPRDLHVWMTNDTFPSHGSCPPRKFRIVVGTGSSSGTLALPWDGLDLNSDLASYGGDPLNLTWDVQHPTVPDNFVRIVWWMEENVGGNPRYDVFVKTEFWFEGVNMGWLLCLQDNTPSFLGANDTLFQQSFWDNLVNATLFRRLSVTFYNACRWGDDPDYQPYRTRP